jgi:ABC-type polysaccharide/polyol phosphate transport system ATPase subunit
MSECIIALEGISKRYTFYQHPSQKFKEILFRRSYGREISALDNVSFSVEKGEALGIIGENGAGKSTLLSIISGISRPSSGNLTVKGKLSSLLELGIGFHPEFTGLQNVYLYGTLLGLSTKEIDAKLSSIIEFSELGDAVQRPVKTYSTGMVVRLAFSVAMAMDPEILIIDEVLSVGDIHFQKKSLDAILKFKENGGSILFCSHSLYHVTHLCEKALWLRDGGIMKYGESFGVVEAYENYMREKDAKGREILDKQPTAHPAIKAWIHEADIKKDGEKTSFINTSDSMELSLILASSEPSQVHLAVGLDRNDGINVYATSTEMDDLAPVEVDGKTRVSFLMHNINLLSGEYNFHIVVMDDKAFNVITRYRTPNFSVARKTKELGIFRPDHAWRVDNAPF